MPHPLHSTQCKALPECKWVPATGLVTFVCTHHYFLAYFCSKLSCPSSSDKYNSDRSVQLLLCCSVLPPLLCASTKHTLSLSTSHSRPQSALHYSIFINFLLHITRPAYSLLWEAYIFLHFHFQESLPHLASHKHWSIPLTSCPLSLLHYRTPITSSLEISWKTLLLA